MAHIHDVIDDDKHFIIDPDTRTIKFAGETMPTLIQFDHNSERFTFEIPRGVDGHDMTLCNKIQVHFININKDNPNECYPSIYEVPSDDITTTGDDDGTLMFTWLIDQSATLLAGPLNFAVRFMCTSEQEVENEEGETVTEVVLDYSLNTRPHEGVVVSSGMDNNETLSNTYYEVVDQWYSTITAYGESAKNDAITAINEAKTSALNNIEQSFDHLEETEQEAISAITNAQGSAVKLIQKTETAAIDNIDEHAESAMENWSNTNAGKDILSQVTALREEVANLADNTTLCKPGVLYGEHKTQSYNNRFMSNYGSSYKNSYLIGESGGPFIISHDYGAKISSIIQVLLVHVESSSGGSENVHLAFEWLNPKFYTDVTNGNSYTNSVGYVDDDDNVYYSSPSGTKAVEYPTESVFIIEPGTPYVSTGTPNITNKHNTLGHCLEAAFVAPIFLGDKRWRAVEHVSVNDIEHCDTEQDMSGVVDIIIDASYLIITAPDNINFAIRQCSSGTSEFTVNANGIAAIEGPVENNLEDTYTIILDNGTTKSFTVPNGNSAGIRTSVSGEIVRCDDVIDVEHTVRATVRSKNLLKLYYEAGSTAISICDGLVLYTEQNGYGSIALEGVGTERGVVRFADSSDPLILQPGTYTFSLGEAIPEVSGYDVYAILEETSSSGVWIREVSRIGAGSSSVTFTLTETTRVTGYLNIPANADLDGYTMWPQVEIGSSATTFTPHVDVNGGPTTITRFGKNLLPPCSLYADSVGSGGVLIAPIMDSNSNPTGAITVSGTSIERVVVRYTASNIDLLLGPGTYTFSLGTEIPPVGGNGVELYAVLETYDYNGYWLRTIARIDEGMSSATFTLDTPTYVSGYIDIPLGATIDPVTFYPQLEVGSSATDFEPYVTSAEYRLSGNGKTTPRIRSISPTMTLLTHTAEGVILDVEYNRDYSALNSSGASYDDPIIKEISEMAIDAENRVSTLEDLVKGIDSEDLQSDIINHNDRISALESNSGGSGSSSPYDCTSGYMGGDYQTEKYLKITVPNKATIFDLTIKQDIDGGGSNAGMYDFITWRLHLSGNFCSGQCSTLIQEASADIPTLYYTTDDSNIYIYLGYYGDSIEAYIKGIIEKISATFESVDSLPSDATKFTMKADVSTLEDRVSTLEDSVGSIEEVLTSIIELQESYIGGDS